LFGEGSHFHETYGFFIDGVDENTAKLPKDWLARAIVKRLEVEGRTVTAVAPAPEDVIVSKLARLDPKDKSFIEAFHAERPLDRAIIEARIANSDFAPEVAELAVAFIRDLTEDDAGSSRSGA